MERERLPARRGGSIPNDLRDIVKIEGIEGVNRQKVANTVGRLAQATVAFKKVLVAYDFLKQREIPVKKFTIDQENRRKIHLEIIEGAGAASQMAIRLTWFDESIRAEDKKELERRQDRSLYARMSKKDTERLRNRKTIMDDGITRETLADAIECLAIATASVKNALIEYDFIVENQIPVRKRFVFDDQDARREALIERGVTTAITLTDQLQDIFEAEMSQKEKDELHQAQADLAFESPYIKNVIPAPLTIEAPNSKKRR